MSGIGIAVAAGVDAGGGPPPPTPLSVTAAWQADTPYSVSGPSGSTATAGFFQAFRSGGVDPVSFAWTVDSNPSGKLGLTNAGPAQQYVTYSGLAVNETQGILARITLTDANGDTATSLAATSVKRTS